MAAHFLSSPNDKDLQPMLALNMTPMIDVLLVLIVLFILNAAPVSHIFSTNTPGCMLFDPNRVPEVITIDVDFDDVISWNGVVLPNRNALDAKMAAITAGPEGPEIHIRVNDLASYRKLAEIVSATRRHGLTNLALPSMIKPGF